MKNLAKRSKSKVQHEENSPGTLANIINNPGLQHLAEEVFLNLDSEKLEVCGRVNKSCHQILANPMFWLKKFIRRGLSEKNQMDWAEAIQITRNTDLEAYILKYLKRCSKNEKVVDIPCYINKQTLKENSETIRSFLQVNRHRGLFWSKIRPECESGDRGILQIMALFLDDPNVLNNNGEGLMRVLIDIVKDAEIFKIFAPLVNDPNKPEMSAQKYGRTKRPSIELATLERNLEAVKVLAPLTDNPNIRINYTTNTSECFNTALHIAAMFGCTEIARFLAPLADNPNVRNSAGKSPLYYAKAKGHQEIVKILAPFADNH